MPSLDEKVLPLMLKYGMILLIMTLWCQKVNIILQMQVIVMVQLDKVEICELRPKYLVVVLK